MSDKINRLWSIPMLGCGVMACGVTVSVFNHTFNSSWHRDASDYLLYSGVLIIVAFTAGTLLGTAAAIAAGKLDK